MSFNHVNSLYVLFYAQFKFNLYIKWVKCICRPPFWLSTFFPPPLRNGWAGTASKGELLETRGWGELTITMVVGTAIGWAVNRRAGPWLAEKVLTKRRRVFLPYLAEEARERERVLVWKRKSAGLKEKEGGRYF